MDLQSRKLSFVQEFSRIQDEDIISGLEVLLEKRKTDSVISETDLKTKVKK